MTGFTQAIELILAGYIRPSLYIGFSRAKNEVSDKIIFGSFQTVSSSQEAVTHQAILTWQNDSFAQLVRPLY